MSASSKKSGSTRADGLPGQLAGEYQILRKLGSGGFGTVYEAEHPVLKRRAAVKVLHAQKSLDDVAVKRFIAEAQAASRIRHRHLVDIFSFGALPNGQLFYVMDLLDGAALDVYLEQRGRLAPDEALSVLRPIAQALDALHAAGVIHRDVKPANIFLAWDESGEVTPKLLDFGLIKLAVQSPVSTASDVLMGTPYYMAPEQCRGEPVDARTDVYALGVIVHELCTGTVPFIGDSASAVLLDHVLKPPPRMSEVLPGLPAALDAAVLAMLAKLPAERPASAGAAYAQLESAAREAGIEVPAGALHLPRPAPTSPAPGPEPAQSGARSGSVAPHERSASGIVRSRRASALSWGLLALGVIGGALLVGRLGGGGAGDSSSTAATPTAPGAVPAAGSQPPARAATSPAAGANPPAEPVTTTPVAVQLRVHGAPPGALVKLGDRVLGDAPGPLALEYGSQPIELTVEARGYAPRAFTLTPDRDATIDAQLE
ncbi:MAG TPA: protein kinase, partial [Polyangiales bacterium]|nr:protein kinase [Polyangiales bacterium]